MKKNLFSNTFTKLSIAVILALPSFAFAASTDIKSLAASVTSLIYDTVPVLFALALLVFLWGVVRYLAAAGGDEKALADGKKVMVYGIIGLAVMASVWGIVYIIGQTFFNTNILINGTQSIGYLVSTKAIS